MNETWAPVHGEPRGPLAALGWPDAIVSYKPFLSYNELGSMLDEGPSELYDALAKILGLDDLVRAQAALQEERSTRDKAHLGPVADERAKKAREALARKADWGLHTVEAIVAGTTQSDAESLIDLLKRLAVFAVPEEAAVNDAVATLREAANRQQRAAQTSGPDQGGEGRRPRGDPATGPSTSTTRTAAAAAPSAAAARPSTRPGTSRRPPS
jgi:hypothetical protein